jgi:hypothetical protein
MSSVLMPSVIYTECHFAECCGAATATATAAAGTATTTWSRNRLGKRSYRAKFDKLFVLRTEADGTT